MAKKKKIKRSKRTIILPLNGFKKIGTPLPNFEIAGRKVFKDIKEHFTKEGHGWPLSYSFLVSDIFYQATGHNLENYLLKRIANSKLNLMLESQNGELVIKKSK